METDNWKSIWDKKAAVSDIKDNDEFDTFCILKKANGFDVAVRNEGSYYKSFYQEWIRFYNKVIGLIGYDIHSVFEVGCGSGGQSFYV